ncbi:MAG: acyltransferase [Anaeroplasmataceae bacterium]|nr:acyltransferase [Anaeroplasmataceae bacterium]
MESVQINLVQPKSNHVKFITVLTVLSCLGVLYLHCNFIFWGFSKTPTWIGSNIIESLFYFSAPMFFMISGATLMDYRDRYNTKTYFKKRVAKVGIPFLVWTFIMLIFYSAIGTLLWKDFFANYFKGIFYTNIESTYYFIVDILVIYCTIPFISLIPKDKRKRAFEYIIILILILNFILPFSFNMAQKNYNASWQIPVITGNMIYPIIGYYIYKYDLNKWVKYIIYLLGLGGVLTILLGTQMISFNLGWLDTRFKGYLNLPCLLYTVSLFTLFKDLEKTRFMEKLYSVCKIFSSFTFGIYLSHKIIIILLSDYLSVDFNLLWVRLIMPIVIFQFLSLVIYLLKKVPYLNKIVP